MKTPHKHADVIKAWADGAEVQYQSKIDAVWYSTTEHSFEASYEWRIKPEPKPDKVVTAWVFSDGNTTVMPYDRNIQFTFCGETGKLKSAEVL
jgi:hypothetical protein